MCVTAGWFSDSLCSVTPLGVHPIAGNVAGDSSVTRRCLKPGEDFSPDEFIGAVADELRDALEGLVEE